MDFTRFVSLLEKRALFFVRLDKLPDPLEGLYTKAFFELPYDSTLGPGLTEADFDRLKSDFQRTSKVMRKFMATNSWCVNQHECAAMWDLYTKSDAGIAIRSTYGRLEQCLNSCSERVYIGMMEYIDYDIELIPISNLFYPALHKRKSYEYENELRAAIARWPPDRESEKGQLDSEAETFDPDLGGDYIPVNLGELKDG